jgi:DNA-binding beta-propeller fold protein YncE
MTRPGSLAFRPVSHRRLIGSLAAFVLLLGPSSARADLVFIEAIFDDSVAGDADGLAGALVAGISPDGRHVYVPGGLEVPGVGGDELAIFTRSVTTGKLTFTDLVVNGEEGVTGLDGPWMAVVSPDGEHVYVIALNDNALVVFDRSVSTGGLTFVQAQIDGVSGVDGLEAPQGVAISPDGKHLYVTSSAEHKVAVFSRNAVSGALTFVEVEENGVGGVTGIESPFGIAVSPDGANVYVAGYTSDAVATFSRNATNGQLLFVEAISDTDLGVDGLERPGYLQVSPDGQHVYVAAEIDDSVAAFERSGGFGELTFVQVLKDVADVPAGLDEAINVGITPDGSTVYVSSGAGEAVVEFSRDETSGELTYERAAIDGVDGVEGIDHAFGLAIAPDGKHLYASGFEGSSIAAFAALPLLFADDFESGDSAAWSATTD